MLFLSQVKTRILLRVGRSLATTRNPLTLALSLLVLSPAIAIGYITIAVGRLLTWLFTATKLDLISRRVSRSSSVLLSVLTARPQNDRRTVRLYRFMEEAEAVLLCEYINSRTDINAWYSPTAFWPQFNMINAPRLTCVPDVVLAEFPIAFSSINQDKFLETFEALERAIQGGNHFVTYSKAIKECTLVARYGVRPDAVTVIRHGANRMDHLIAVTGFPDGEKATEAFCRNLFKDALRKAIGTPNADRFDSGDVRFIFYASQFRPNKNIINLLRAYNYLLRRKYIALKLVLTGNPNNIPEIADFIRRHRLENDVLCLHGLTDRELAACYRIADLAINPSLSEGGCPFTLTEALSVGTPVIMARIAVTEEMVTDPALQEMMLFDPYSWRDMANRIEWALSHTPSLLNCQLALYVRLSKRSWHNVVDEYVSVLDWISSGAGQGRGTELSQAED